MTRTEYLNQLEAYLMKLPQSDRIEAMDYFKELFDDAGPEGEEDLIASLGSPKEAAHDVLTTLLDKKINEENSNKNNRQVLQIAIIALLAAPIGIPVGIGLLMAIIGIFIAAVSVLMAFFAVSVAGLILGGVLLFESFYVLAESTSAFDFWRRFISDWGFVSSLTSNFLCDPFLWITSPSTYPMDS